MTMREKGVAFTDMEVNIPSLSSSPRVLQKVQYEQCPWDRRHVLALYTLDPVDLVADNKWHPFPHLTSGIGWFRIYDSRFFQALVAPAESLITEKILTMTPVESADDAEWDLLILEEIPGFWLGSRFTQTFGPFPWQEEIANWLRIHKLALLPFDEYVQGVAWLPDINNHIMAQAMEKLIWLENAIIEVNRRAINVQKRFWTSLMINQGVSSSEKSLPVRFARKGSKFRQPLMSRDVSRQKA